MMRAALALGLTCLIAACDGATPTDPAGPVPAAAGDRQLGMTFGRDRPRPAYLAAQGRCNGGAHCDGGR